MTKLIQKELQIVNKNLYQKDKTLVEKLEQNLLKMRQKSIFSKKICHKICLQ